MGAQGGEGGGGCVLWEQVDLLVACKSQLCPLLHVRDPDKLLARWGRGRPNRRHSHLLIPLERPAQVRQV